MRFGALAVVAICGSPFLLGQSVSGPQDPAGSVHRLARQVEEDMRQIDHLLQKASRPPETEGLLAAATETQGKVIRGIDDMLAQLHEVCCTCPGGG